MRIYVICDMEGISGVVDHRAQCWPDGAYIAQAGRVATMELNAMVEGALAGGATEITAWDGHSSGFPPFLDPESLHPECRLLVNAGDGGPPVLDQGYDAVYLLGLHAMAGTRRAVLAHSFMPHIEEVVLNGVTIGEIGLNCAIAGNLGIPVVFVSGDKAAVEEARALVPGIESAIVKEGLSPEAIGLANGPALCLPTAKACEIIKEAAANAARRLGAIEPWSLSPPYRLRVRYREERFAEEIATLQGVERVDSRTIAMERDSIEQLAF